MSNYTGSSFISQPVNEELNLKANLAGGNTFTDDQIVDDIVVGGSIKSAENAGLSFGVNSGGVPLTAMTLQSDATADFEGKTTFKQSIIGGISQSLSAGTPTIDSLRLITKLDTRAGDIVATINNGTEDGQIKILNLHRADPALYKFTLIANVSEPITLKNVGEGVILAWSGNTADWSVVAKNVSFLNNDLEVDGNINLPTGKAYTINNVSIPTNTDLTNEINNRTNADTTLQANIDAEALTRSTNDGILTSDLAAETLARTSADNVLQVAINTEVANRTGADTTLQANIDAEALTRATNDGILTTDLTAETTARTNADNVLQGTINTEINNRTNADTVLQNNIDAEALTRATNDGILTTDLTAETLARTNADNALQGEINTEVTNRTTADTTLQANIDLKAPIDNADLTGLTKMDRLQIDHSDSTTIGVVLNNTNVNQYAGSLSTSAYGWRMFNNNTGIPGNTTFGVYTKGDGGVSRNPLLVKNDAKLYTLAQEVDGDINLSAGSEFKIDGVPIGGGGGGDAVLVGGNAFSGGNQTLTDGQVLFTTDQVAINGATAYSGTKGIFTTSVGPGAGLINQGNTSVAVGQNAAKTGQGFSATAVGPGAGFTNQGQQGVAIGNLAAGSEQGVGAIAIGTNAGYFNQGENSLAIGVAAGTNNQAANSIVINATGSTLNNTTTNSCVVAPIRTETTLAGLNSVYYNTTSKELVSGVQVGAAAAGSEGSIQYNASGAFAGESDLKYTASTNTLTLNNGTLRPSSINFNDNKVRISADYQYFYNQGDNAVAIGYSAGNGDQGEGAVAIGKTAAHTSQGVDSVAIGIEAAYQTQGLNCVAIGKEAGYNYQQEGSIAIGSFAGRNTLGPGAIAIGQGAGYNNVPDNTIVISGAGGFPTPEYYAFYVRPIRQVSSVAGLSQLYYNPSTYEIVYN